MKSVLRIGVCVLITGCLLSFAGCKKKTEPAKPAAQAATDATKTAAGVKTEAASTAPAQPKAEAIETIPVADVKAEASKMNVEQLKTKAMEYKNAIDAKRAEIDKVIAKLQGIPAAQQMGTEAKGLQTDLLTLNNSVSALTERFQVYYDKLKEMGGDVSSLQI